MALLGTPRSFHSKWKFRVEIEGFSYAGFQSCSEVSVEAAKNEHWEGGRNTPDKQPGRLTHADVTLQRGATTDLDMYDWMKTVADASRNAGLISPLFKRNVSIVQLALDGRPLRRVRLFAAWPVKFVVGDWDNDSDENTIEQVTLTYDRFDIKRLAVL